MQNPITLTKSLLTAAAARRNQFTFAEKKAKGKKSIYICKKEREALFFKIEKGAGVRKSNQIVSNVFTLPSKKTQKASPLATTLVFADPYPLTDI